MQNASRYMLGDILNENISHIICVYENYTTIYYLYSITFHKELKQDASY